MIDPKPGHGSTSNKVDHQLMRGIEHFRQFHSDRGQIVHVGEAAIVNFFGGDPPEREPIRLRV